MKKYDYMEAMKSDILDYIRGTYSAEEMAAQMQDLDSFLETLHDDLWIADRVTGNGSGSYTCNAWRAEEYLCHNLDLLAEAAAEFCCDVDILKNGAEYCDVTIRCYLLNSAIAEALEELQNGAE